MFVVGGVACQSPVNPCEEEQAHIYECIPGASDGDGYPPVEPCDGRRRCVAECVTAASCEDLMSAGFPVTTPGAHKLLACADACLP